MEVGYSLQFVSTLPPSQSFFMDHFHEELLLQEVQSLLQSRAIEEVPLSQREGILFLLFPLILTAKEGGFQTNFILVLTQ